MAKRKATKTRFVPRMIVGSAALVSVVPAVALIDCGSDASPAFAVAASFDASRGSDAGPFSVGVSAFDGGYDANPGVDATSFTVASVAAAFDAGQDTGSESEGGNDSGEG